MTVRLLSPSRSLFLIIDLQARLLPAIYGSDDILIITKKIKAAAELLDIPVLFTEQNPAGLGHTTPELSPSPKTSALTKMTFNSCEAAGFEAALKNKEQIIVAGSEAHVCVLQTVLGLMDMDKKVYVLQDAIGSRALENKNAAISRMKSHGAEIVTSEMVLFEWLKSAEHPKFKDVLKLIK
ncbi:MAG: isochorismatase family protein [Sneathiella sp.]